MEKFEKVNKPERMEFYSIELDNKGEKQIHLLGWCYDHEDEDEYGNPLWSFVEPSFLIVPLKEFVENRKGNDDYVESLYAESKQYQGEVTETEAVDGINHFFQGKPADCWLPFSDITLDTPCGNYVS